ncbi:hypothetical protein [Psychrobacter sp. PSP]|uniref:hypothetical protein n=1 Tax=Psychrobacter sp. PSP TaxID=2734636 RepID=UPI002094EE72|nr:hypothetical protein [Psychrobacter sp. PSP]
MSNSKNQKAQSKYIPDLEYITKKVNALSVYDTYWCLFYLRSIHKYKYEYILKNDKNVKLQLLNYFSEKNLSKHAVDSILKKSADNNIPYKYTKWFYNNKRAALWLYMVLKYQGLLDNYLAVNSNQLALDSDIDIFIHDIIFNIHFQILEDSITERDEGDVRTNIYFKKSSFDFLNKVYLLSGVENQSLKWINKRDKLLVNHLYKYMAKNHLKNSKLSTQKIQALVSTDTIKFPESDIESRLNHMLASLDYWAFDYHWLKSRNIILNEQIIASRNAFIKKMRDVWFSKAKRDRDKKAEAKGLRLTTENKKLLKLIAKNQNKTLSQMLNDIIESYSKIFHSNVPKTKPHTNAFLRGDYGKTFFDSYETQQSLEAKINSTEAILENNISPNTCEGINDQIEEAEDLGSLPYSKKDADQDCTENETLIDSQQTQSQTHTKESDDVGSSQLYRPLDRPILDIALSKTLRTNTTADSHDRLPTVTSVQEVESFQNTDLTSTSTAYVSSTEEDPFAKNSRIINEIKEGGRRR